MKQAKDAETVDLPNEPKRGRGRPRLENAMSDAERARLYRARKKERPAINRAVTKKEGLPSYGMLESRVILLNSENMRLTDDLEAALDRIAALEKEVKAAKAATHRK